MTHAGGRPSKLTMKFIKIAEKVIDEYILACTDKEIVFEINDRLDEKERITDKTYQNWKAGKFVKGDLGISFFRLVKKTLMLEKNNLIAEVRKGDGNWQSRAWILERKFNDWNIRMKIDVDHTSDGKELKALTEIDEFFDRS